MINIFKLHRSLRQGALSALIIGTGALTAMPAAAQYVSNEDGGYIVKRLGAKPLPFGAKLSISHSYKVPGMASLDFKSTNVESSCASIDERDVVLKDTIGILEIEFSDWAIQTYKMLDKDNKDVCGQHSYAEYKLPLDLEQMVADGVKQLRIWNQSASDAFKLTKEDDGSYVLMPVTEGKYFKVDNYENILTYMPMPEGVFRVFPDYAPHNEELMLRKVRAIAHERDYKLYDYTVRYDDRKRPYYIMLDNKEMAVIARLKDERFFNFDVIDIDEDGRVVPLRINIGRL
tara:strand:+ start:90060 stop:90923 length:864 start_codon:yes stop_codon:yes gene_type:complete